MSSLTNRRWSVLVRVLLFIFLCAVMLAAVSRLVSGLPGRWSPLVLGSAASLGAFALTAFFLRWDNLRLEDVGVAPRSLSALRLALGFLIGLLLVVLQSSIVAIAGHVRFVRSPGAGLSTMTAALTTYLALSWREELAFHGYPLRRLEQPFGPWVAQLIVAFVFAVEHVIGGVTWMHSIFGAAVGSLLFGMAALATRGLAVPIGIHAAWNFGQWTLGEKETSGLWQMVVPEGFRKQVERIGTISYVIVMATATLLFWWWYRRTHRDSTLRHASDTSPERKVLPGLQQDR